MGHAKQQGIVVLLEGVETEEQPDPAQDLGIDPIKGWLTGRHATEPVRSRLDQSRPAA